jgi:hypothetical protein
MRLCILTQKQELAVYAAAIVAAYAKELLSIIPAQEIVATTKAVDAL